MKPIYYRKLGTDPRAAMINCSQRRRSMSCTTCGYAGLPTTAVGESWCPKCDPASAEFLNLCAKLREMKPPRILHIKLPRLSVVGRNDPCPCGSERKYKRCHGR